MAADVGSKAPDFTLSNQDKQPVTLSSLAGKTVVLAFFPAAFTSVCQKELCHSAISLPRSTRSTRRLASASIRRSR
jgi:peroxiredoxin